LILFSCLRFAPVPEGSWHLLRFPHSFAWQLRNLLRAKQA
jgi:hypothetical protein